MSFFYLKNLLPRVHCLFGGLSHHHHQSQPYQLHFFQFLGLLFMGIPDSEAGKLGEEEICSAGIYVPLYLYLETVSDLILVVRGSGT